MFTKPFDPLYYRPTVRTNRWEKGSPNDPADKTLDYYRAGFVPYVNLGYIYIHARNYSAKKRSISLFNLKEIDDETLYAASFPTNPWNVVEITQAASPLQEAILPKRGPTPERHILQVVTRSAYQRNNPVKYKGFDSVESTFYIHPPTSAIAFEASGFKPNMITIRWPDQSHTLP